MARRSLSPTTVQQAIAAKLLDPWEQPTNKTPPSKSLGGVELLGQRVGVRSLARRLGDCR
jgi:hypothetical protein